MDTRIGNLLNFLDKYKVYVYKYVCECLGKTKKAEGVLETFMYMNRLLEEEEAAKDEFCGKNLQHFRGGVNP